MEIFEIEKQTYWTLEILKFVHIWHLKYWNMNILAIGHNRHKHIGHWIYWTLNILYIRHIFIWPIGRTPHWIFDILDAWQGASKDYWFVPLAPDPPSGSPSLPSPILLPNNDYIILILIASVFLIVVFRLQIWRKKMVSIFCILCILVLLTHVRMLKHELGDSKNINIDTIRNNIGELHKQRRNWIWMNREYISISWHLWG